MRITPIDIETKHFPMRFRGFHPEEVSSFLEQIREELEDLLRENATLKERIHKADDEIQRFGEMQDLLSRTLQDAHQMSEEYKVHAQRDSNNLLEKAEETARGMTRESHEKALQIREEIMALKMMRKAVDDGIRSVLRRFEEVIAGGIVFQRPLFSDETATTAESGHAMKLTAEADKSLFAEDQINMIEGQRGEEGSSEAEQH